MAAYIPVTGTFAVFGSRFFSPALGFTLGTSISNFCYINIEHFEQVGTIGYNGPYITFSMSFSPDSAMSDIAGVYPSVSSRSLPLCDVFTGTKRVSLSASELTAAAIILQVSILLITLGNTP